MFRLDIFSESCLNLFGSLLESLKYVSAIIYLSILYYDSSLLVDIVS